VIPVAFAGEKESTEEAGWPKYSPTFNVIAGPYWKAMIGNFPSETSDYLLLPASCEERIIPLTYPSAPFNEATWEYDPNGEYYNFGKPPAEAGDIAMMEYRRNGRNVVHSRLLAKANDGGRISLFQYETTSYGLVVIAYINGEKVITTEFISTYVGDVQGEPIYWHSELPPETFGSVAVAMLCESDAGLIIGFTCIDPEGDSKHLLGERDGRFIEFSYGYWEYNIWENSYQQNTNGLTYYESWPALDSADLAGEWVGDNIFTFNTDGTGEVGQESFRYVIDGNIIVFDNWCYYQYAKIEEGLLYLRDISGICYIYTRQSNSDY
jgi:hypothetical protein